MTIRKIKEERNYRQKALLKRELDLLKEKMTDYDDVQRECDYNNDKLKRLFELGIINENANPINNDMN